MIMNGRITQARSMKIAITIMKESTPWSRKHLRLTKGADTAVEDIDLLGDVGWYAAPGYLRILDCAGGDTLEDPSERDPYCHHFEEYGEGVDGSVRVLRLACARDRKSNSSNDLSSGVIMIPRIGHLRKMTYPRTRLLFFGTICKMNKQMDSRTK